MIDPAVIIGIDFGTTRSAAAFKFRDMGSTKFNKMHLMVWPETPAGNSPFKGPTAIIYEKTVTGFVPLEIGYSALKMKENDKRELYLLTGFKLHLGQEFIEIKSDKLGGLLVGKIRTVQVVGDFLRLMKNVINNYIKTRQEGKFPSISDCNVNWCLSVPAIWTYVEKNRMIEAAKFGGLTKTDNPIFSKEIEIVLEPEAAATTFKGYLENINIKNFEGKTFMVVDLGGGTVDLTVNKFAGDLLEEIIPGNGNRKGGDFINGVFFQKLGVQKSYTFDLDFEKNKRSLKKYKEIDVRCPRSFRKFFLDQKQSTHGFEFVDDEDEPYLFLSANFVKELFEEVVLGINDLIKSSLGELKKKKIDLDYIYLVGGLSNSEIIKQTVSAFADKHLKVVWPDLPETSIVQGTLCYGENCDIIKNRIMRATYGIDAAEHFNPAIHKDIKPEVISYIGKNGQKKEKLYVCGTFAQFAVKGASIPNNKPTRETYHVLTYDQKAISLRIFKWNGESAPPNSVLAPGMEFLGGVSVPVPGFGSKRPVVVEYFFGRPTLEIECYTTDENFRVPLRVLY